MEIDKIYGIYSFPKSGNTWMRHIVSNLIGCENAYDTVPDVYSDNIWNNPVKINSDNVVFYKSHSRSILANAHGRAFEHDHIFYIVRNPLDVFLSQLNYVSDNVTSDQNICVPIASVDSVLQAGNLNLFFGAFCVFGTLQPKFADAGNWFENAEFWKQKSEANPDRVTYLRYEDLLENGVEEVAKVAEKIGVERSRVEFAYQQSNSQTRPNGKFFWKQKSGNYLEYLPLELVHRFWYLNQDRLKRLGYADLIPS
ncbi:MAG: sulfotransferase domain-containing protein [Balneola sp.]|nr:sulfotransferase domain-containing protein [Balneola sp.]